ncbi:response regulator transcription factor [Guptibacillus hwajinpoensis]|uniref:response regulator transcription factor n=1 Tax=Guptibacillus hwajinpoensis TaxID=208199 RepID=UPI0024B36227|nr:response regulator transcription factor [Pseudalkalibacillus hwajinpoensis]
MKYVLTVDDEERMVELISLYLEPHGYRIYKANTGFDALTKLNENHVDMVLLDIMMPDMDGWKTCEEIRKQSDVPIIMLTAREQSEDIVKGLKLGADDYITKPFDERVLLARMEAVARRLKQVDLNQLVFKGLTWDADKHLVSYNDSLIPVTPIEFKLLGLFLKNPEKVFSRDHLIQMIWGFESSTEGRTIDSHIRNLRDKCRSVNFQIDEYLVTIWGVGYKWKNLKN